MDNALDRISKLEKASHKKPKKIQPERPSRAIPKMIINKPKLPTEALGHEIANVVNVPEEMLRKIANNVDRNTAAFNDVLLSSVMPLLLSYETGTNYACAALRDGLNLEVSFDEGLGEAVKHIGYLNVLFFYVKRSRLPVSVKKRFVNKISDLLAEQSILSLVATNKLQERQSVAQDLQAVVYSGRDKKATVHTRESSPDKLNALIQAKHGESKKKVSTVNPMPVAVKRRAR